MGSFSYSRLVDSLSHEPDSPDEDRKFLEARLSSELGKVFISHLRPIREEIYQRIGLSIGYPDEKLTGLHDKIDRTTDAIKEDALETLNKFFNRLMKLGIRDGLENPRKRISSEKVGRAFDTFMNQSDIHRWLDVVLEEYKRDMWEVIVEIFRQSDEAKYNPNVDFPTLTEIWRELATKAVARFKRHYSRVSVEVQAAINSARALEFTERDPERVFRYKWGIRRDHKTTDQCKMIAHLVEEYKREHGEKGVPLEWLKAVINVVAVQYDPKWRVRDWVPHFNCRSQLQRMVI